MPKRKNLNSGRHGFPSTWENVEHSFTKWVRCEWCKFHYQIMSRGLHADIHTLGNFLWQHGPLRMSQLPIHSSGWTSSEIKRSITGMVTGQWSQQLYMSKNVKLYFKKCRNISDSLQNFPTERLVTWVKFFWSETTFPVSREIFVVYCNEVGLCQHANKLYQINPNN